MDALVVPFNTTSNIAKNTHFAIQSYIHSSQAGNYPYEFIPKNVFIEDDHLALRVQGKISDGKVLCGELHTKSTDFLYGTFRSVVKFPAVDGTCAAMFYWSDDTQEIDIEVIGYKNKSEKGEIYVVTRGQSGKSYERLNVPSDLTSKYQEIRFDWTPQKVDFYIDGTRIYTIADHIPSIPGPIILQHWSSGDPYWSGGPPTQEALFLVKNVEFYFNSTDRLKTFNKRCEVARIDPCPIGSLNKSQTIEDQLQAGDTSDSSVNDHSVSGEINNCYPTGLMINITLSFLFWLVYLV